MDSTEKTLLLEIRDTVVQLRTVVLGTDGYRGMHGDMEQLGEDVQSMRGQIGEINQKLPSFQTVVGCQMVHQGEELRRTSEKRAREDRQERRKLTVREWVLIVLTAIGLLSSTTIAIIK